VGSIALEPYGDLNLMIKCTVKDCERLADCRDD
jgi:hypothetical protein